MPDAGTYGGNGTHSTFRHMGRFGPSQSNLAQFLVPFAWRDVSFVFDDFNGADATLADHWTLATDANGTAFAKTAGIGGTIVGTAGDAGTDNVFVAILTPADWEGDKNCGMEVRWQVDDLTDYGFETGFSDPLTDSTLFAENDIDTPSITNGATDVAVHVYDSDEDLDFVAFLTDGSTSNMNTTATSEAYLPTAATYLESRVQIVGDAASGFIHEGYALKASASHGSVTASQIEGGVDLTARFTGATRATATTLFLIDYFAIWQNRR